jgi:hypothetical protein
MSILLILLPELQRSILTAWLDLEDVSRLDSACCCKERQQWMSVLYSPTYDYVYFQFQSVRKCSSHRNTHILYKHENVDAYVHWVALRSVRLTSFYVPRQMLSTTPLADHL